MTTVAEIRQKAERKFPEFLKNELRCLIGAREDFFPLDIKADKGSASDSLQKRGEEIRQLMEKSKEKVGRGYTLDFDEVNTRNNGRQSVIKRISFGTENDYLSFIGKKAAAEAFRSALLTLEQELFLGRELLHAWAVRHLAELCDVNKEKDEPCFWHNVCLCANWLHEHPQSGLYVREIPLAVHTKFIEQNKSLILGILFPQAASSDFETLCGLRQKPYCVRFRPLDAACPLSVGRLAVSELSLPLEDFARCDEAGFLTSIRSVIIVENEMVYLTFPAMPNALCVWGHGFSAAMLGRCAWLSEKELFYFGDVDEHGFLILSEFRKVFPATRSLCMDMETLRTFDRFRCKGKVLPGGTVPPNLDDGELEVFLELRKDSLRNRLEQERISVAYLQQQGEK